MLLFNSGVGFAGDLRQNTALWVFKPNTQIGASEDHFIYWENKVHSRSGKT